MRKIIFVLALLVPSRGLAAGGADPYAFLLLDSNARAAAMGGAYTSLASGTGALNYNAAGLSRTARHEVSFMHNQYFQGITQEFLHYASPYGWGVSFNQLSFGKVSVTTLDAPDGSGMGDTTMNDLALGTGYGLKLGESLSVGAGAKYIRETIDATTRNNVAFDLGALYAVPAMKRLSFGAAMQNLGQTVRYDRVKENQPLMFRLGGSYVREFLGASHTLSIDIIKERSDSAYAAVGVETVVLKTLDLRLGYNQSNDAGPGITAGVGYEISDLVFDYSIVPYGHLGCSHRMALSFRWGGEKNMEVPGEVPGTVYISPK